MHELVPSWVHRRLCHTLVSAFLDFSAGIIVMSHPQLPPGLLCWVPSLPASPVSAKWTSTTICPEPEIQFNLHSESMTWQCTWSHIWQGAGKTELYREEGGQGWLELPCPPIPEDYPSFRTRKHILDDHWSQATLVRGRSLCKVASVRLLNGS